jgi:hypothetical protein
VFKIRCAASLLAQEAEAQVKRILAEQRVADAQEVDAKSNQILAEQRVTEAAAATVDDGKDRIAGATAADTSVATESDSQVRSDIDATTRPQAMIPQNEIGYSVSSADLTATSSPLSSPMLSVTTAPTSPMVNEMSTSNGLAPFATSVSLTTAAAAIGTPTDFKKSIAPKTDTDTVLASHSPPPNPFYTQPETCKRYIPTAAAAAASAAGCAKSPTVTISGGPNTRYCSDGNSCSWPRSFERFFF